jgi:hypothetical protein
MFKEMTNLKENIDKYVMGPQLDIIYSNAIVNGFKNKFFSRVLLRKSILKLFLRYKDCQMKNLTNIKYENNSHHTCPRQFEKIAQQEYSIIGRNSAVSP